MIEITVEQKSPGRLRIQIKGHAGYADKGKDIVCAGVSTLFYTLLNHAEKSAKVVDYKISDQECYADIVMQQLASSIILTGFEMMAEEYPDYVKMEKIIK